MGFWSWVFGDQKSIVRATSGIVVNGQPRLIGLERLDGDMFLSSDQVQITFSYELKGEGKTPKLPETIGWRAIVVALPGFLVRKEDNPGTFDISATVAWVNEGVIDFDLHEHTVNMPFNDGPFIRPVVGSRQLGPFLEFHFWTWLTWPDGSGSYRSYKVGDTITGEDGPEVTSSNICQTWRDALRQEYVDFQAAVVPSAGDIKDLPPPLNSGNYYFDAKTMLTIPLPSDPDVSVSIGMDGGLGQKLAQVLAAYHSRAVVEAPITDDSLHLLNGGLMGSPLTVNNMPVFIPKMAQVKVASGYRNPRRNVAVGSKYPVTSKHTLGRALDLVPVQIDGVTTDGSIVALDIHKHLFPTLLQAARSVSSSSIGEDGATPVAIGDHSEDHVHIQW